ncbi:MAG: GNAT family N-acyltransferase [Pararhodobacter sp.]
MSSLFLERIFGPPLRREGWVVRPARTEELPSLRALRGLAFRGGGGDGDAFDADCLHLWIGRDGEGPRATIRVHHHPAGVLHEGYSAQYFDLGPLAGAPGPVLELGRLCAHPDHPQADLMRLIWAGVTRLVEGTGAARLIGCSSLQGTDPGRYSTALAALAARHLGPDAHRPRPRPRPVETFAFGGLRAIRAAPGDLAVLPPLLRAYLAMGGWVGDHLVIDRDLGTCIVFTCVEIASMPDSRKRVFRALAG